MVECLPDQQLGQARQQTERHNKFPRRLIAMTGRLASQQGDRRLSLWPAAHYARVHTTPESRKYGAGLSCPRCRLTASLPDVSTRRRAQPADEAADG